MKGWLIAHAPEVIVAGFLALVRWFGVREVKRIDYTQEDHEDRLRGLEQDRVTRDDFDELRSSLTASIVHSGERVERQVDQVMQHLLARRS